MHVLARERLPLPLPLPPNQATELLVLIGEIDTVLAETRPRTLARTLALTLTLTLTLSLQANPTPTPATSKVSSELGGIVFICLSPYARPGGMVSRALPPTFIICSPSCHPGITELSLNSVGSPRENDESKTVPSLSVPV